MKFSKHFLGIILVLFVFYMGCGSQVQKAEKISTKDPKSAINIYEQVMKTKPGTDEAKQAHLKIAETYYKQMEDYEKGLQTYEEVAKAYPKTKYSGEAYWAIAMHYFQAKEYEKAKDNFAKVTEEVPNTDMAKDAELAIAKSYEEMKNLDEAAKLYLEFSKANPQHRRAAQSGLDAAKLYEKLDKIDEAVEAYKFVASQYSISSSGREAREALTNMGIDLSEVTSKESEAPAVAEQSSEPEAMANIGARTRRRASNVPRSEITTRATAAAEEQQARSRSVSPDFGVDVMQIMPSFTGDQQGTMYDAMYMIGITYLQSGQYKEAGALFEKSIELAGNKPWPNSAKAYFYLGKAYKGIGNNEKSKIMLKEAIKRDSKIIDEMIRSGETQYGEEEYQEALDTYMTALGLVPYKDGEIYYKMGLVYQKLKDADNELEAFEKAVALKPNNIDAVQHLAEVLYYRKSDPVRAALFDSEARGQGNNDYKVQKEIADLCYKYDSYSWARTKYGNGIRVITTKINDELKKAIGTGEEAKKVSEDPTKINLKTVQSAADSGVKLASDALQKVAPLIADLRFMNARMLLSMIKNKQIKDAQQKLEEIKTEDLGIENTAEFQFAVGLLALEQGNKEAGIAAIKKALEIDPNHQEASAKLKELGIS
ncbi:MAG: tetratricopeptide repeat protein [bacterium]